MKENEKSIEVKGGIGTSLIVRRAGVCSVVYFFFRASKTKDRPFQTPAKIEKCAKSGVGQNSQCG